MPTKVSAPNSLLTGSVGMMRVKAAFSKQASEEHSVLFGRIDELASDRSILLAALKNLSATCGTAYESADGLLVMRAPKVEAFKKAHELARIVISQAETIESR